MLCPGCGQYVGTCVGCPNCGADLTEVHAPPIHPPVDPTLKKRLDAEAQKNTLHLPLAKETLDDGDKTFEIQLTYPKIPPSDATRSSDAECESPSDEGS